MAKTTAGEQPKNHTEIDLINQALKAKNISINALADETGIAYSSLRRSLKGGRGINFMELRKIAAAISVRPSELLPADLKDAAA